MFILGQNFNVSVVTVGQVNGVVPLSVQAQLGLNSQATEGLFQNSQNSQNTQTACIQTSLYSKNDTETLTLTAGKVVPNLNMLLQCPEGFELSGGSPAQCICQKRLQEYTSIDDQKIHRTTNFWSGYDNATQGLVLHLHCPLDYCIPHPNNWNTLAVHAATTEQVCSVDSVSSGLTLHWGHPDVSDVQTTTLPFCLCLK